jgi:hypothetical protein
MIRFLKFPVRKTIPAKAEQEKRAKLSANNTIYGSYELRD